MYLHNDGSRYWHALRPTVRQLWEDFARYPHLSKLINRNVLRKHHQRM